MNECTRCGIEIEAGVHNQIRHDGECKGTKDFPVHHLSEMGIPHNRTFHFKSEIGGEIRHPNRVGIDSPQYMTDYCIELGCKEGKHHPECALNPVDKKNNNWDNYNAKSTKESAQQRFIDLVKDNKWLVLIGLQIIVAAILKIKGIL